MRILSGGMIGDQNQWPFWAKIQGQAVAKAGCWPGNRNPQLRQSPEGPIKCKPAQAKDDFWLDKVQLFHQKRKAIFDLFRFWSVLRRGTPTDGAQKHAKKGKAIVLGASKRLICQSRAVQSGHEKIASPAGTIAGEHPSCSVSPMGRGSQTHKEKPSSGITKTRNGVSPIGFVAKCRGLAAGHLLQVRDKPRAGPASDDARRKRG